MKTKKVQTSKVAFRRVYSTAFAFLIIASANPAFAQITKVNTTLTAVQTTLVGVSAVVLTCAIMWVGFKMMWQHAKWDEVKNVLFGGILVGGAAGMAAWLLAA